MCGFVGIVTTSESPVDREALERSLDKLAHRGPDMRGVDTGPGYGLSHVRLAILDLHTRAAQPMWDRSRRYALVYNGQVFNYAALKQELVAAGREFRTTTDSEVVLEALIEWGAACLPRLSGQFAFAWFDTVERQLLLARDPLGIKPLVYWRGPDAVLFASEPSAIVAHPLFRRRLNLAALPSFLSYRQVLGNETYYEDLHELEPGSSLELRDGRTTHRRYWRLDGVDAVRVGAAELRSRVGSAVRQQTVADVPLALLLSGGLDSSILAAEASRAYPSLIAYTASVPGDAVDESDVAARVAAAFGVAHVRVPIRAADHDECLESLVRRKGAPLGMHNEVALHLLARRIRDRAKVVLCGEGADELFAGYGRIFRLPFETATRRNGALRSPFDVFAERYEYFPLQAQKELFDPVVWSEVDAGEAARSALRRVFEELPAASFFERIWWVFVHVHLRGLLGMVDAMTMAAGIEARVPFLDPQVVTAAYGLRERDKLRWRRPWSALLASGRPAAEYSELRDETKYMLRRAYRGTLSREVLHRRKQPFPMPLAAWYGGAGAARTRSIVLGNGARLPELMRRRALGDFVADAARRGDDASGRRLFQLVNLELFLRQQF